MALMSTTLPTPSSLAASPTLLAPSSCSAFICLSLPTNKPAKETTAEAPSKALRSSGTEEEEVMSTEAGGRIWAPKVDSLEWTR